MKRVGYIVFVLLFGACTESFELPRANELRALVVDGRITDQVGFHTIKISNTKLLNGDSIPRPEGGATVMMEEENGPSVQLTEVRAGLYRAHSNSLPGQIGKNYRLHIRLSDGIEYQSSWELMRPTPPITEVRFEPDVEKAGSSDVPGAQLYIDSFSEESSSFFRWEIIETWRYEAPYATRVQEGSSFPKPLSEFHKICWMERPVTDIMLAAPNSSNGGALTNYPLHFFSSDSARLDFRYSALIKQYAIGQQEFSFWKGLKSTAEDVGSLYDNQPFQLVGNIKNINNPEEPVFGYFSANAEAQSRIYISREEFVDGFLPEKTFSDCDLIDLDNDHPVSISLFLEKGPLILAFKESIYTTEPCGDCEAYGGKSVQPNYWEE